MSQIFDYDVAVIGSGPGGYVAAIRAAQLKQKTIIIEREKLGGVCLNIGCIPSKALINQADIFHSRKGLDALGCTVDCSGFDYKKVYSESRKAADSLSKGVAFLMKKNAIAVVNGEAKFKSKNELDINNGEKTISARSIIIATGSRPRVIPGFEFDETTVLSSTGGLMLQTLPKSMLILGGGAIGVEFAHIMNAFGVDVHIVEMMDRLLPLEDDEISQAVGKSYQKRGINIYTSTKALQLTKTDSAAEVVIEDGAGKRKTLSVEKVLVVVGRVPNTENIGLESVGITTDKGYVPVGDYNQTATPGIYAIGDIVSTPLLAHVASKEGEIAAEHCAGHATTARIDLQAIPGAVYCEPQVASFGMTLKNAQAAGIKCSSASFPYRGAGKSVAIGKTDGFVKIVFNTDTHEILGAHLFGAEATEMIHELLLAKTSELLPNEIAKMIHAHPTLSETVMEASRAVENWAIHT